MIVAKFGGTSLADAERFRHVAELIRSDPRRRYVVVSAPGKRFSEDIKMTDLLYRFQESRKPEDFQPIEDRFTELVKELGLNLDLTSDFDEMKSLPHNAAYMASCGEYLSARIMADYLGWPFIDSETCVFFQENGTLDEVKTKHAIFEKLRNWPNAVLPGYYGVLPNGEIQTFSRGGSDISGALVASAMEAKVYENWTDVDGILSTDPRIVPEAALIESISYAELRELAYRGATVLHEDSVLPVQRSNIPIHICNTFRPEAPGSWILPQAPAQDRPITGIAEKKGYTAVTISKTQTNGAVGYMRRILSCFEKLNISIDHIATGLGSLCLAVPSAAIEGCREELKDAIFRSVHPDCVTMQDGIAMIAVVGRGMTDCLQVREQIFHALAASGIKVRIIDQSAGELNIVIGVNEEAYESAVRAIHRQFF